MKKKVLAIMAAVMVLSFGTTAFAANSPVAGNVTENVKENAEQKAEVSSDVKTDTPEKYAEAVAGATATVNGTAVTITVTPVAQTTADNTAAVVKEQLKDVLNIANNYIGGTKGDKLAADAKDAGKKIGAEVVSVSDVTVTGMTVSASNPVTITFPVAGVTADSYVLVLHFNSTTGKWENIPATTGNGTVTATFTSLSPVAIVKLSADTKPAAGNNNNNNNNNNNAATTTESTSTTTENGAAVSPKTGAEMPVVAIIALVCAAGAVVCTKKVKFN